MKKITMAALIAALIVSAFAGCGGSNKAATDNPAPSAGETQAEDSAAVDAEAAGGVRTGYSVHTTISSSADATAEANGKAQVDTIIVYTTTDADGKLLKVGLDSAQSVIPFNAQGQIDAGFDLNSSGKTKMEKGAEYGMKKASGIGKEWNEQADALAQWATGKTVDEVTGMQTKKVDDNHLRVPDIADLTASVTMDVGDYLDGIKAASQNPILGGELSDGFKTGLGVVTSFSSSKNAADGNNGAGQVDSVIAVVSLDSDGKIAQLKIDNAQTKVEFGADGTIKSDKAAVMKSKQQLKDDYGMKKASQIGKEWYEQADAFAQWCIGKSIDEVKGLKTKVVDESHTAVPDIAELSSSVTISVEDYMAALEKAVANAK